MLIFKFLSKLEENYINAYKEDMDDVLPFYDIYRWFFKCLRAIYNNYKPMYRGTLDNLNLTTTVSGINGYDEPQKVIFRMAYTGKFVPIIETESIRMIFGQELDAEDERRKNMKEKISRSAEDIELLLDDAVVTRIMKVHANLLIDFLNDEAMRECFNNMTACIINTTKEYMAENDLDRLFIKTEDFTLFYSRKVKEITMIIYAGR